MRGGGRVWVLWATLGIGVALTGGGRVFADDAASDLPFLGPLPVRIRSGITGAEYLTEPESAEVLGRGRSSFSLNADDGNSAMNEFVAGGESGLTERDETQALRLRYQRGVGKGWDVSVLGELASRNGGMFGDFINWWHGSILFGYQIPIRNSTSPHADFLYLRQNGQLVIDLPNTVASTSLAVVEARKAVVARVRARHPLLVSVREGIKVPMTSAARSEYLDDGAVDTFTGVEAAYGVSRRLWLHANVDLLFDGTDRDLALTGGRTVNPETVAAAEYLLGAGTSAVFEMQDSQYPYQLALPYHFDDRRNTTIGVWRAFSPRTRAFLALSENFFGFEVTAQAPQVVFSTGVQYRL
jgi:hypothetical protein